MVTSQTSSTSPILSPVRYECIHLLSYKMLIATLEDPTVSAALQRVLQAIFQASSEPIRNVQHNNAQNAILFEAIGLAIHLDPKSPLVGSATVLLAQFILSKETNVRYLGLDTLAHLAARAESLEQIKRHQKTILLSLRDKDISVRRRALDLLYSMCDVDNAELIVGELLRYLKVADYGLREEMVLKIAISTEKFATSYKWYVDTILQLISTAGDHVGDEVWYRVIQIVTNTEDLQEYAAKVCFEHLKNPTCHESLIKIGGTRMSFQLSVVLIITSCFPQGTSSGNTAISSLMNKATARSSSSSFCKPRLISARRQLEPFCYQRTSNGSTSSQRSNPICSKCSSGIATFLIPSFSRGHASTMPSPRGPKKTSSSKTSAKRCHPSQPANRPFLLD